MKKWKRQEEKWEMKVRDLEESKKGSVDMIVIYRKSIKRQEPLKKKREEEVSRTGSNRCPVPPPHNSPRVLAATSNRVTS